MTKKNLEGVVATVATTATATATGATSSTLYSDNFYISLYTPSSLLNPYNPTMDDCPCGHPEWHEKQKQQNGAEQPESASSESTEKERMLSTSLGAKEALSSISLGTQARSAAPRTTSGADNYSLFHSSNGYLENGRYIQSGILEEAEPQLTSYIQQDTSMSEPVPAAGLKQLSQTQLSIQNSGQSSKKRRRDDESRPAWERVNMMDAKLLKEALIQLVREEERREVKSGVTPSLPPPDPLTTTQSLPLPQLFSRYQLLSNLAPASKGLSFDTPLIPKATFTLSQRAMGPRDWNKDFQTRHRLLDLETERERVERSPLDPDPELRTALDLTSRLLEDFFYAAKAYARIIISEFGLPDDQKTISRANIGGIAGGEKYIAKGILFKFAQDKIISRTPRELWMYGGDHRDDGLAIKAAAKEFLALQAFLSHGAGSPKLHMCPSLMMIIDYKGFRLIATPLLPIDKETIVYGSNDSGLTVHMDDPLVNEAMKSLATKMNIQPHHVGPTKEAAKLLHAAGDFEVHKGKDGTYYSVDFGRFLPPEAPCSDPNLSCTPTERRSVFYKFLRPEYATCCSTRLSPDAFSAWSTFDEDRLQNEKNLRAATENLFNVVIPKVAAELEKETEINFELEHNCLMQELLYDIRLIARVRFHGVNLRHLGRLRRCMTSEPHRKLVLSNCVGRVIKNMIHAEMRSTMQTMMGTPTDLPFRRVVVKILNIVLGRGGEQSTIFWTKELKERLQQSFHYVLDQEEQQSDFDLRSRVDLRVVLFTVTTGVGIVFRSDSADELMQNTSTVELLETDISELLPRTRQPYFSYTSTATLMRLMAYEADNENAVRRLLMSAHHQCHLGSLASPKCPLHNIECANLELTFADRLMKQYNHSLREETATNDTRWTVEWLFDSAFNHTEESISCMATLTSLHLWAFIATKYSEWKTLTEEKEQAEAYLLRRDLHKNSIEGIQGMPSCQIARNFSPEGKKLRTFREELKASYPLNLKPPTSCIFSHNTAGFLSLSRNF